mmetsp:Transcript_3499/g.13571  ORF Transcript_3499/g.13571 Transcript_3499/m.13571 type:complete len:203 (+) Transcript_3499:1709-2317(+)
MLLLLALPRGRGTQVLASRPPQIEVPPPAPPRHLAAVLDGGRGTDRGLQRRAQAGRRRRAFEHSEREELQVRRVEALERGRVDLEPSELDFAQLGVRPDTVEGALREPRRRGELLPQRDLGARHVRFGVGGRPLLEHGTAAPHALAVRPDCARRGVSEVGRAARFGGLRVVEEARVPNRQDAQPEQRRRRRGRLEGPLGDRA